VYAENESLHDKGGWASLEGKMPRRPWRLSGNSAERLFFGYPDPNRDEAFFNPLLTESNINLQSNPFSGKPILGGLWGNGDIWERVQGTSESRQRHRAGG
jgi:hypothetical protein